MTEWALQDDNDRVAGLVRRASGDFAVLVAQFALYLTAFIVIVTLVSVGAGLAVLVVGLFGLLAGLAVAGWAGRMNRALLASAGIELPPTRYPAARSGFRGRLRRLAHPQSWRDVLHVLVSFPLATATSSFAVTLVVGGLGGVTYAGWSRWLPAENHGLPYLLGFPGRSAEVVFNTVLGGVLLLVAPAALRGMVRLHAAVAYALLVDESAELRQQVSELTASRSAAGAAETMTLRRLERDLHDGPQQRLVRLAMDLSAAERKLDQDPDGARRLIGEALQQSQDALAEVRQLSRGIAPPILTDHGLAAAIMALAARGNVRTAVDVAPVALGAAAQNAAYFVVAEALANVAKHSCAQAASVEVREGQGIVVVEIIDDGIGGASLAKGHGLAGLADRRGRGRRDPVGAITGRRADPHHGRRSAAMTS